MVRGQAVAAAAVWTFTTPQHEAYPAVVCRFLMEKDGSFSVATEAHCFGTQAACDRMMAAFGQLDRGMAEYIKRQQSRPSD